MDSYDFKKAWESNAIPVASLTLDRIGGITPMDYPYFGI